MKTERFYRQNVAYFYEQSSLLFKRCMYTRKSQRNTSTELDIEFSLRIYRRAFYVTIFANCEIILM